MNTETNPGSVPVSSTLQSNSFFRNGTSNDCRFRVTTEPIDLKETDSKRFSMSTLKMFDFTLANYQSVLEKFHEEIGNTSVYLVQNSMIITCIRLSRK